MALDPSIADIRKDYKQHSLSENDVDENPIQQFSSWWKEAVDIGGEEINAMTLATCNSQGQPSARIVLLKSFSDEGFIFFTNYESRKGKELANNPNVALVFFWKELERQVRIEGVASKISPAESEAYFLMRPIESQLGAWSSPQSRPVVNRQVLEQNMEQYRQMFSNTQISRPTHWGGYIVRPSLIEFWQGRPGRLHDRIEYTAGNAGWHIQRLAP